MKTKIERVTIRSLGRKISDATILMHEAIAKKAGLTGTDHKYLSIILDKGTLTAGELSKLTGLTTGAVTGLIDRLEKKKLLKRTFDKLDRRKILLVPNADRANKLFENSHLDLKLQIEDLIAKYTDKEIAVIQKYLLETIEIMNKITNQLNEK